MNEPSIIALHSDSSDRTRKIGATLARAIRQSRIEQPLVIALEGDLGAGKTTFASGFLRALGASGVVRSPTYTLIEPYELKDRTIHHLDLYRLGDARELEALGVRDLVVPGTTLLVEWADRGRGVLPEPDLTLAFGYVKDRAESDRSVCITATTTLGNELAASLQALFNEAGLSS
jgi:tRNA threonylcarbamoyladenosine biosynthesis protein TsaE